MRIFSVIFLGGICSLFLSIYYYITLFAQYYFQSSIVNVSLALESPTWKSSTSWIQELVREMGSVNYYYYYKGYSYPNAQPFIHNGLLIAVSFVFPIFALAAFLFIPRIKKSSTKWFLLLLGLSLVALFFAAMGVFYLSPTRDIYQFLYDVVPFFSIFRDAYKPMFLIHFIYAILIAYTLYFVSQRTRKLARIACLILLVCTLIISYQFWSGQFFKYEIINIPQYWNSLANFMQDKRQDVTLLAPNMPFQGYDFSAIKGINTSFFRPIFNNNVIYEEGGSVYDDNLVKTLYRSSVHNPGCFVKLSGFLGTTYIINQYDLYVALYKTDFTPQQVEKTLQSQKDLTFVKDIGKLKIYKINQNLIYSNIYIPEHVIQSSLSNYCSLVAQSFGRNSIAFIQAVNYSPTMKKQTAHIRYKDYGQSVYSVTINNHVNNTLFVLNKRYDGGWKLYDAPANQSGNIFSVLPFLLRRPANAKHILVNNFANGWDILNTESTSNNSYLLIYMPQLYFYVGLIISLVSIVVFMMILILFQLRRKHEER